MKILSQNYRNEKKIYRTKIVENRRASTQNINRFKFTQIEICKCKCVQYNFIGCIKKLSLVKKTFIYGYMIIEIYYFTLYLYAPPSVP